MNDRIKYLVKNIGILTISNFASKILVFLLVPLYTSVLSKDDVGVYDIAISTVTLLFPILTLNIVDAVMRFLMDHSRSKEEIAIIGIKYISISTIPIFVFLLVVNRLNIFQTIQGLEGFIFLYYFFYVSYQFLIQFAKGIEKVTDMGIAGVIGTVSMLSANILFLLVFKWGLRGFFVANILAQAIPTVFLFIRLKLWKYIKNVRVNKALQKEMLLYCTPLIATVVGWWVNHALDKYVVVIMIDVAANGLLAVSYKIPQIINTLQSIFIQAWQISAIKEYESEDKAVFYGKAFVVINALIVIACSFLILATKPLAYVLYKKEFYEAWQYVPFLLIASVLNSASGFMGPILSAKKDSRSMAMSAIYGSIANLVLNVAFVYLIGIQGACVATALSSFIIYLVRKRAVGREISIKNYWTVLLSWGILCVQACIEIYTHYWWIEITALLLLIILNVQSVKPILHSFIKTHRH